MPTDLLALTQSAGITPEARLKLLGLSLRNAQASDDAFLFKLFTEHEETGGISGSTAAQRHMQLRSAFNTQMDYYAATHPSAQFWIVVSQHAGPVGRLYLDRSKPLWNLLDLLLLPPQRGKGYGTALLAWLQDEARLAKAAGIELQVKAKHQRGEALYAAAGFRMVAAGMHHHMVWTV